MSAETTALLRVPEAAAELRLSVRTVYRLVEDGELAATHVGKRRSLRVTRDGLTAYIERNARS